MNPTRHSRSKKPYIWLASGATAAGLALGIAGVAHADNSTSTTSTPTTDPADASGNQTPPADPASLPNGPGETVLTGDTATRVKAAVDKALPDATIIRMETDADAHVYEAHVKKADGTVVTLYFDSSFAANGQDNGFGGTGDRGPGHHGRAGGHDEHGRHGAGPQGGANAGRAPSSGQTAPQTNSGGSA